MFRTCSLLILLTWSSLCSTAHCEPPPDATWTANAKLENAKVLSIEGLGAAQGVSLHDGKVYLYGDVWNATPRVGVIREYTADYQPTKRVVWLRKDGRPILIHPTGLTWSRQWGTFLGDTVQKKAVIYQIDWDRALADGNLDHAVLHIIDDDVAVNGCRPEFVSVQGKELLATADYGDVRPEVRLYDPEQLVKAERSSAPGVVAYRFLCGPFNQNLSWDAAHEQLTCIQNVIAGRGWQLEILNLPGAIADGRASAPAARVRILTFLPHSELEGYRPLGNGEGVFITSSPKDNLTIGKIKMVEPRESAPGKSGE